MYKLGHQVEGDWVRFAQPPRYRAPAGDEDLQRLEIGVPESDPRIFLELARTLAGPFFLLYVLHTPRGEAEAGRYQSPRVELDEVEAFVERFGPLLRADSRFDLWLHSPADHATLVWDRHDRLFAYGPLGRYATALRAMGLVEGNVGVPAPHQHHYHAGLDAMARELIARYDWRYSPLQPGDEQ
jgi:hypothetical protein